MTATPCYTLPAVRARLSRKPASTVSLFWPGSGALVEVTRANLQEVIALWKAEFHPEKPKSRAPKKITMLPITALFRKILAEGFSVAISRYLTGPLSDETAEQMEEALFDGLIDSEDGMELEDAFMHGGDSRTVSSVLETAPGNPWFFGDAQIDELDANSVVGARVIALILRADYLIADMPDEADRGAHQIIEATKAQCNCWFYG